MIHYHIPCQRLQSVKEVFNSTRPLNRGEEPWRGAWPWLSCDRWERNAFSSLKCELSVAPPVFVPTPFLSPASMPTVSTMPLARCSQCQPASRCSSQCQPVVATLSFA
jgi:hypothetical protein